MVDSKDLLILEELSRNGKASVVQLSKKTGLPPTTVHNRIKKLRKEGVIKKYTIDVDKKKIGKGIAAYIAIIVDYRLLKEKGMSQYDLAEKIKKGSLAEEVSMVTGTSDIIVKMRSSTIEELNDFVTKKLRHIDGVEKTQTMVVLSEL